MFSESQIARMDEVEFMSELYMLILYGVTDRTQIAISRTYKSKDVEFPEKEALEFRVAHTMSLIEETFGERIRNTRLTNKAIFYVVFGVIYHLIFGHENPLEAPPRTDVRAAVSQGLRSLAAILSNEDQLPEEVKLDV